MTVTSHSRFPISTILACLLLAIAETAGAQCAWNAVIQHLAGQPDERSKRASENLSHFCAVITVEDIKGSAAAKKCLGPDTRIFGESDNALLKTAFGKIAGQTLKVLIPTVTALLGQPALTAVALFLTPSQLGKDAIAVIRNPDAHPRSDIMNAAKLLLWDTDPKAFREGLSTDVKAGIEGCILAQ